MYSQAHQRRQAEESSLRAPLLGDGQEDDDDDGRHQRRADPTPPVSPTSSEDLGRASAAWQKILRAWLVSWAGFLKLLVSGSQALTLAIVSSFSCLASSQKSWVASDAQQKLPPIPLTPVQEARLEALKQRVAVPFDEKQPEHQEALSALWSCALPGRPREALTEAAGWKEMGWQGNHPSSDFRGGGFMSLENLVYFAKTYPRAFRKLMRKEEGRRSEWEYPFAAAGVNLTVVLTNMLDLRSAQPCTQPGLVFLRCLEEEEHAFEELYCALFVALDEEWLRTKASYMEFNVVLNSCKDALEEALSTWRVKSVQDLPQHKALLEFEAS